ncbi:hypothetical protein SAMN04487974_1117 [Pelagibacterium luteolum]|uniref:Uncharacterized protein n=1 Tax=Pelagibacterium luteolum TaxID=440168 RepID=A0A1G7XUN2_9HYPH|nr:hypothetical protein SAMN04487974_1117 [Pelagibacterium luteolum]
MAYAILIDRVIKCPGCLTDNEIIGSDLAPGTEICCSSCGRMIDRWSEAKDRFPSVVDDVEDFENYG